MAYPRFVRSRAHKSAARVTLSAHLSVNYTAWTPLATAAVAATVDAYDVVLAECQAGDVIEAGAEWLWNNESPGGNVNIATIVAGSVVTYFSPNNAGVINMAGLGARYDPTRGSAFLTLVGADIADGSVRLRTFVRSGEGTGGAKTIYGTAGWNQIVPLWARNLGPAQV